jgi:hypothetical protein
MLLNKKIEAVVNANTLVIIILNEPKYFDWKLSQRENYRLPNILIGKINAAIHILS